jgi:hypothetical protein
LDIYLFPQYESNNYDMLTLANRDTPARSASLYNTFHLTPRAATI